MKKLLALLIALIMVVGLVACGGNQSTSSTSTPAGNGTTNTTDTTDTTDTTKTPSRTDVKLSLTTAWTTSDPIQSKNVQDNLVYWNMSDFLLNMNEATGQVENRIAKSYSTSADGLTWTFELRDDVKFHNGDTVKASDVVFSLKRAMDSSVSRRTGFVEKIADVVAKGDFTVDIILESPYSPLLVNLCNLPIISEKVVTEQGANFGSTVHEAGCGPYKLVEMKADSKIVLEAFDGYYLGTAPIKTITYSVITDTAAATVAFESGDLDWYNCSVTDYTRIMAEGKFAGESLGANHLTFLAVNGNSQNAPALADKKVRQAIFYAINLQELNYAAFDGTAAEALYMCDPNLNYGFPASGLNTYEYNLEKAKSLLAEAGYAKGVNAGKLLCFTGSYFEVVATMVQSQLAAAGINVELEWNEQATVLARGREQDYDMYISGTSWTGDGGRFTTWGYTADSNLWFGSDYDLTTQAALRDAGNAASDVSERMKNYTQFHNTFMDYAAMKPLLHKSVPIVYNKDLNPINYPANQQVFYWSWN